MSRRHKLDDVCRRLDLQPYVVGFWRSEFPALVALGRDSGADELGEEEVLVVQRIRELLYDEGCTIEQARATIESELEQGGPRRRTAPPSEQAQAADGSYGQLPEPSPPEASSPPGAVEAGAAMAGDPQNEAAEPAAPVPGASVGEGSDREGTDGEGTVGQDIGSLTRRVERLEGGVAALVAQARQLAAELRPDTGTKPD